MRVRILALTIVWGLIGTSTYAGNPTYSCDRGIVETEARIVVYPNDEVAIHGDRARKVCTFAVNGATVDGPPARKPFRGPDIVNMLARSEINSVLLKVTAAPRVDSKELKTHRNLAATTLKTVSKDLAQCFLGLVAFGTQDEPKPQMMKGDNRVFFQFGDDKGPRAECWVFVPGNHLLHSADQPVLQFTIRQNPLVLDRLYVPRGAIQ